MSSVKYRPSEIQVPLMAFNVAIAISFASFGRYCQ